MSTLPSTSPTRRRRRVSYTSNPYRYIRELPEPHPAWKLSLILALIWLGAAARGIDFVAMKWAHRLDGGGK